MHSIRVECRLVQIVSGDVDISGSDLMMALQEASENTVVWKLARPMKTFETFNQTDFVAGMAHTIGTKLEEEQAADQAAALSLVSSAELSEVPRSAPRLNLESRNRSRNWRRQSRKHSAEDTSVLLEDFADAAKTSLKEKPTPVIPVPQEIVVQNDDSDSDGDSNGVFNAAYIADVET
ncbi:hypothetical protein Ndes2526A_g03785 [Nannochloris sp. 'desiccata']